MAFKRIIHLFTLLIIFFPFLKSQNPVSLKIWDNGDHNAFSDLIRFKSYFYCAFREGKSHVPKDTTENGSIRIIKSKDLKSWESVVLISSGKYDLRDPKLSIDPGKRLMVIMGGSHYVKGTNTDMMPHVCFSADGSSFTKLVPVSVESSVRTNYDWIWRVSWKGQSGYSVMYQSGVVENQSIIRLLMTNDGINYKQIKKFDIKPFPNEATIRFDKSNNMFILLRRENGANGMIGQSSPPYQQWTWKELKYRLGGPNFLFLRPDEMIIGTRHYGLQSVTTAIYLTDRDGNIKKIVQLPSGGDSSYPGLLFYKKEILISYYSSHEGKASIYLTRINIKDLKSL